MEKGQPAGGLTITVSVAGRMPLQEAFFTSPCRRTRLCLADRAIRERSWVWVSVGKYRLERDHGLCSRFFAKNDDARLGAVWIIVFKLYG